jgi:5-(carboxyamino)imidazole ribonucleotide synthase
MFAIAARRMGYRVHTFSPETDTPTGQVADVEITAPYDDLTAVKKFAQAVRVVTFEFENVPAATAAAATEVVPVRPNGTVLHTTQHRLREKILRHSGFPSHPSGQSLQQRISRTALRELGCPVVLRLTGYDMTERAS